MIPGMNPRMMKQAMKRMGIQQQEIDATEVVIKTQDKQIIITEPQVSKINMGGQETFQIVGNIQEASLETQPDINEEDVQTVAGQAGVDKETAQKAIEEHEGDLAAAIMSLQKE